MRNDRYDDIDDVPNLSARDDDDDLASPAHERTAVFTPDKRTRKAGPVSNGGLWAVLLAVVVGFGGLAWWSFQQMSLMEQQLVATQESFARISEEAAGRLQDISGRVSASQSALTDSEALKAQVKQLQDLLAAQDRQRQETLGAQGGLDKRLEQLASQQQTAYNQLQEQLKGITGELATLKTTVADAGKWQGRQDQLDGELKTLSADVAALKKQGNPSQAIERLEQDMIVLKSEQENRPAASSGNTAEFDAFRGQVTRNINTLQSQIQTLSQQINAKR